MIPRHPTGHSDAFSILSSLRYQGRLERRRQMHARWHLAFFGGLAFLFIVVEMALGLTMFSAYAPSVGGYTLSAYAFAPLIAVLFIAMHLKVHDERDLFTKSWLRLAASAGVFLMALGISSMIALSFLDVALAVGGMSTGGGLEGTIGDASVNAGETTAIELIHGLLAPFPPLFLFFGLAFSLILSAYVVNHFLIRAIQALRILQTLPNRPAELWERCDRLKGLMREKAGLMDEREALKRKLPADLEQAFARDLYCVVGKQISIRRRAAYRIFRADWQMSPLRETLDDAEAFPPTITSVEQVNRMGRDILDGVRVHNVLSLLSAYALPQQKGSQS